MRLLLRLPLRQTQGFIQSLLGLMGLALAVPDYSTLSRRQGRSAVVLPNKPIDSPMHLVVDSTGLQVYGQGEWKVRQHGWSKRRTWRKLHVEVNGKAPPLARDQILRAMRGKGRKGWKQDSG